MLLELVDWMNEFLKVGEFPEDQALNGLQVESGSDVKSIALATDAANTVFEKSKGADLLIVHHGLYWKGLSPAILGEMTSRVRYLLDNKMSLYAAHLPLDAHPDVGNNACILRELGFAPKLFKGMTFTARANLSLSDLLDKTESIAKPLVLLDFGPDRVENLFVCSGAGTSELFDLPSNSTYITGEFSHYGYHYAKEKNINVIALGHYVTETFGVKALGKKIKSQFGIPVRFVDFPTGL